MAELGIEMLSVFGLPPVEFIALSAELGCRHISTGLSSFGPSPHGYAPFSIRDDAQLRRDMIAAMRDTGVSISLAEGLTVQAGASVTRFAGDLDIFRELGAARINTVSMDPEAGRTFDEFAILAEMAADRGMVTTTEFAPGLTVPDLPTALAAVAHVGRDDFRLLIDTMHLVRSGSGPSDVAALDPAVIDYVQVSDATLAPRFDSYFEEAMFERMVPGEGELGLASVLAVLPPDRVYALEVPMRSKALAGILPREAMAQCVAATRQLLNAAHLAAAG